MRFVTLNPHWENLPGKERKPQLTPEPNHPFSAWLRAARPSLTSKWGRSGPEMVRSRSRGPSPLVFYFISLFFLILALRSDGFEPPPPPPSSTTFLFTSHSSNPILYGGDLLESLGGSSLQRIPSLLSTKIGLTSRRRDLPRWWMFGGHRVWIFLPARVSITLLLG